MLWDVLWRCSRTYRRALLSAVIIAASLTAAEAASAPSPLLEILSNELSRNLTRLQREPDSTPYFISYAVTDQENQIIAATLGAIQDQRTDRGRTLDCTVRIGSYDLDSTHTINGDRPMFSASARIPVEDNAAAIQRIAWRETDRAWRSASDRWIKVRNATQMKDRNGKSAPDFSHEKPVVQTISVPTPAAPNAEWTARLRRLSGIFNDYPRIHNSSVVLSVQHEVKSLVTSEGTKLQHGRNFVRIFIIARAKAVDGQDLTTTESFEAEDLSQLPKEPVIAAAVKKAADDLSKMLLVQPVDPYVGPAILSGRAAGVFFHEIFGHRIEGHRQLDEAEGQTFSHSVNQSVLPEFLSVTFDATRHSAADTPLFGWYHYDDEGVPGQKVTLVDHGILKSFLMSRMPLPDFPVSNGHGRKQPGLEPVSRQSNLLVESSKRVSDAELRKMLVAEVKRQGKPYGLYFDQVTGGFTTTRRQGLQAFTVIPLVVYRVYPDGRPDELVRGVDIVGTPLSSFAKIIATGDKDDVFNGYCGAESGSVPVSAVSPALLVSEIEVQRKATSSEDRPPFLPRPSIREEVRP